ncbi:ATP-binding protein [Prevotella cerevisiae]|uniref:ATP-binding protein n=1 Tax=Segatella cerevisiae TaxID=2053716 RepID=A0ABT1BYT1_9BACT|nr:ATP-binding protein [Segatella cerevisiae]MCO6025850.1 ATP-binding protein [Segatella cerevisiae]
MKRPFVYGELAQKENFIDREEERQKIKTFLGNGINVMLISPRRWGKSSLIKRAMQELTAERSDVRVCFIDAFRIHTEAEFYNAYATAVINGIGSTLEKAISFLKKYIPSLKPSVTFGNDSLNAVSLNLNFKPLKRSAEEILDLPEKLAASHHYHVIICIDEFQQLAVLPEWKNMEGMLRSVWQQQEDVNYCLYGSKRHMMLDIFNNSNNPFYRFGQTFYLNKISREHWIPYILKSFRDTGKTISPEMAGKICDTVECHSWYVQQLSFFVWSATRDKVTDEIFNSQLTLLIDTNAPVFETDTDNLVPSQINMLKAIADGEMHFNAKAVNEKYELGAPQSVSRNQKMLIRKDIIEKYQDRYTFVDPVFKLWFVRNFC